MFSRHRLAVIGTMLSVVLAASISGPGHAESQRASGSCPSANHASGNLGASPSDVALPVGGTAALSANSPAFPLKAGTTAVYKVICGPDKGQTGKATVKVYTDSASSVPTARLSVTNSKGPGRDLIQITVGSGSSMRGPVTVAITWTKPVSCKQSVTKIGFMRTLQCKATAVKPMLSAAYSGFSCGYTIGTFAFPAAKLAKVMSVLKDTKTAVTAARVGKAAGVSTNNPVVKLVLDLNRLRGSNSITLTQIQKLFGDGKSTWKLADFLRTFVSLVSGIRSDAQLSTIAGDIASLLGFGSCRKVIELITRPS